MKYRLVILVSILFATSSFAQQSTENYKLTGAVSDLMTSKPLVGVSVIVSSRVNGNQLGGTSTDEKGFFAIDKITEGKVRVKFSMVGYQKEIIDSVAVDKSSRLGLIRLLATTIELPEVTVKSVKPMIEFQADKQIINVDRLPGNSGTLTEALKNSGLVEVEPSTNKITVRGQDVKLQMDGHEYSMPSEMLAQLPATMIDQVEVILSPGAKESAEGGTYIINFITKKESFSNYSGMISINNSSNDRRYGGLYFNYKANKLNLFAQGYGGYFGGGSINESERYVYTSPTMYYEKTSSDAQSTFYSGYFKLGMDYDFDENNTITFYTTYDGYKYNSDNNGNSFVNNINNVLEYSYNRLNGYNGGDNSLSFYGFYKKKFSAKGHELTFDAMYTLFSNPSGTNMTLNYSNKPNVPQFQNSNTGVTANTLIFKIDYALPINSNKFETGYNLTYRTRNNDYNVSNYSYQNNVWYDSLGLSNLFKYRENIHALYVSYAHKIGDFDVKFGVRAENLSTEGNQITQKIDFKENFLSFFPNFNASYKISDMFQLGFNAFRRVTYPQIYYVNPFRTYRSPNSFYAGNPKLGPSYTNSYAVNLSQYISLYYTKTTGNFTYATATENDSVLISSYINLNREDSYGVSITLPYYNTPMMPFHLPDFISSLYVSFNYYYAKQSGQYITEDLSLINRSFTLNGYIGFKLWYDIEAEVSLYYRPKVENQRGVSREAKYLSFYFRKNLLDRKLRIYVYVTDVLNASKGTTETIGGNYYLRSYYEMKNSRGIGIGISYLINDYKDRRDRNISDGRDASGQGGGTPQQ